jgi:4-amino-4-deoxy-L-arabinose transferase-like glycosyltransferase
MEPTLDRSPEIPARPRRSWALLPDLLLVLIVMVAAALRLVGTNWDESQHLHPDERFLTMVETDIRLPDSLGQYFDTTSSPLNPHNAGHGFFVYGTLPIFIVRVLAEWTGNTGYDQVTLLGRTTSAVFDLVSIGLIYLVGRRLYRRRVGLLAAALAACTVLFIQHAHFFVVESFVNTFILASIYCAVRVQQEGRWRDFVFYGLAL